MTRTPLPSSAPPARRRLRKRLRRVLVMAGSLLLVWTLVYEGALRERLETWGTTRTEATAAMAGDSLVPNPHTQTTRAVATTAIPEDVWPWIAQYGVGRGGLYSYDWIETLIGMPVHSATRVDPALQDVTVGDRIRYTPEGYVLDMEYRVVRVAPPHLLVLTTPPDAEVAPTSIAWMIRATPNGSRIVLRWRSASGGGVADAINHLLAPAAWLMERKELLTIAERAAARSQG